MPNRILKESICTSDNIDSLTPNEEVFFYRLIVNCDDYGIIDARSSILRSRCFPLKINSVKESDIEKWLIALINAELIFVYEAGGRRYLKMTSWEKHQQIRAKRSKFPMPDIGCNQLLADDIICPRNPIQSESNPNPNPNPTRKKYTSEFETFWDNYPKHIEKSKAFAKWQKLINEKEDPANILQAALHYSEYCTKNRTEKQYIKYPATFLNAYQDWITKPKGEVPLTEQDDEYWGYQ